MVTFPVDDVTPATEPLPTQPLSGLYPDALAIGGDPARRVVVPDGVHPLLSAVARAFAEHRPLVLSPDAVWLTIAQGVAQHVRLHAEELRPLLVNHAGRKRIAVQWDGPMPEDAASWQFLVEAFSKQVGAEIFECDFTTSTSIEQTASRVVMLDAYSPYFSMWLVGVCGIPSITLTGTVEDWRKIRDRVDHLEKLGLEKWCRSLRPIADQFVRAASGTVDPEFWKRIYNPADAYGGDVINGWIARFYPYVGSNGTYDRPNPLLDLPISEPKNDSTKQRGIRSDNVPAVLSKVVIHVQDLDNHAVALHAGLVGVAQDNDFALRPIAGWHLTRAGVEMDDVIDRLAKEHEVTPADASDMLLEGSAEQIALDRRVGSAVLFDGAWRIRPHGDRPVTFLAIGITIQVVIDLADGRHIALAIKDYATVYYVACRIDGDELADDPRDVPVYGTSLAILLEAAMDFGGDISSLETGKLTDLID
ncbi:DUF4419 domain-containing protein [Kibdelosporangium aridum]|uniref:DUF4419 domain-containing protein n=1 Tax=Kibdelosporangium aridum TaxID=2030 RepID=A0A428Z1G5_KIBAR|nr:DUF4419 domain-containing protein [Kibdelosporangium aridum]RSM78679.1 DUF4419 domain-containing protein [Kibdelosporangium aridum]